MSEQDTVSFGFEEVTPDEKVDRVKGVFRSVASKYDVMNDFMATKNGRKVLARRRAKGRKVLSA